MCDRKKGYWDVNAGGEDLGYSVERDDGTKLWYLDDMLHREDGPAVIRPDGTKVWYLNGMLHREDGPAVVQPDGTKLCYLDDMLHREDGPAVVQPDGYRAWWLNGMRHKDGGPAVEYSNGYREWWLNGKQVTQEEVERSVVDNQDEKYWVVLKHWQDVPFTVWDSDKKLWDSKTLREAVKDGKCYVLKDSGASFDFYINENYIKEVWAMHSHDGCTCSKGDEAVKEGYNWNTLYTVGDTLWYFTNKGVKSGTVNNINIEVMENEDGVVAEVWYNIGGDSDERIETNVYASKENLVDFIDATE